MTSVSKQMECVSSMGKITLGWGGGGGALGGVGEGFEIKLATTVGTLCH